MNVILLEKLPNLGDIGDVVKVKAGFARNYLLPQGKARVASSENLQQIAEQKQVLQQKAIEQHQLAQNLAEQIKQSNLTIKAAAGEEGKLFGSIGNRDITQALNDLGINVERRQIILDEGALRYVGKHQVRAILHTDVQTTFDVIVETE